MTEIVTHETFGHAMHAVADAIEAALHHIRMPKEPDRIEDLQERLATLRSFATAPLPEGEPDHGTETQEAAQGG
jgi:hypothetical protein